MSDAEASDGVYARIVADVSATYDNLHGIVRGLVERGARLRDLAQSSDDLEQASDILRERSRRARFSRRQLSLPEFALGVLVEHSRVALCTFFLIALALWLAFGRSASVADADSGLR